MARMSQSAHEENLLSALRAGHRGGLTADVADAAAYLSTVADQLDKWAHESKTGGWSTHQVVPNIALANSCRRMAARLRGAIA